MFEEYSKRNRAIQAALELAAEGGWRAVTFAAIAERTGLSLADLRRDFIWKTDLLSAFQSEVDAEVLAKAKPARRCRTKPSRSRVRHDHDAVRGHVTVQARTSPYLQRSLLPSGGSRAAHSIVDRLAILDASRRRRQA